MKKYLFVLGCLLGFPAVAQDVVVPHNVYLAGLHLKIDERGRREIQKKVDALRQHPSSFQIKVDRADTFFPIIERVFKEEGLPDDFKYLVLQESGLIGDAVSTSNAVGYWQFKKEAASDQGLRINNHVDERKHIIESSRGAARYLVRHNAYCQNWLNTLLSYNLGLTGSKRVTKPSDIGARKMEISARTHPYLITFLAHKIAFETAVGKNAAPPVSLQEVAAGPGQSLSEIALASQIDPLELEKYNKWLVGSAVPGDKTYTVLIPVIPGEQETLYASQAGGVAKTTEAAKRSSRSMARSKMVRINDLQAVIAGRGETKEKMARRGRISVSKFLRINELRRKERIVEGETYYLQAKRNRAEAEYHVAQPGEDIASLARQYGVKEKAILAKNRMQADEKLEPGRVVWLQRTRPRNEAVAYRRQTPATPGANILAQGNPAQHRKTDTSHEQPQPRRSRIDWRGTRQTDDTQQTTPVAPAEKAPVSSRPQAQPQAETASSDDEPEYFSPEWTARATPPAAKEKGSVTRGSTAPAAVRSGTRPAPTPASPTPATEAAALPDSTREEPVAAAPGKKPAAVQTRPTAPAAKTPETSGPETEEKDLISRTQAPRRYPVRTGPVRRESNRRESSRSEPAPTVQQELKEEPATPEPLPAKPTLAAPTETPDSTADTHVVAKSETLFSISRRYGIPVADLMEWNNLGGAAISVGQVLVMAAPASLAATPAGETASEKPALPGGDAVTVIHTVAPGETIYQISRKYGVTIKDVMEWNKKRDFNVKAGENLEIKPK